MTRGIACASRLWKQANWQLTPGSGQLRCVMSFFYLFNHLEPNNYVYIWFCIFKTCTQYFTFLLRSCWIQHHYHRSELPVFVSSGSFEAYYSNLCFGAPSLRKTVGRTCVSSSISASIDNPSCSFILLVKKTAKDELPAFVSSFRLDFAPVLRVKERRLSEGVRLRCPRRAKAFIGAFKFISSSSLILEINTSPNFHRNDYLYLFFFPGLYHVTTSWLLLTVYSWR